MKRNNFLPLVGLLFISVSCGQSVEEKKQDILFTAYDEITTYAVENQISCDGYAQVGHMTGNGSFDFYKSSIKARYAVTFPTITSVERGSETGELSNLEIKNSCGLSGANQYYPISLQGRWQPNGSGGGKLVIAVSKKNEVIAYIFGDGNWAYGVTLSLKSSEEVLRKLVEAKKRINELDGIEEIIPAERFISHSDNAVTGIPERAENNQTRTSLRSDIPRPQRESMETVSFPLRVTYISSGDNFTVKGASYTYFAYVPSEHWGVLIMRYENNAWARRYIYCTGWEAGSQILTFSAYDQKTGKYIGELEGKFTLVGDKHHYTSVFTNYKGLKSATFYIVED